MISSSEPTTETWVDSIRGKASILSIGTELTTGQITNRNAAWISEKLSHLGIEVLFHKTVPDDHMLIQRALDYCAKHSQLIFITGGLGPTTDDFTRNVISTWLNKPLQWDEQAWERIVQRLSSFQVPIAQSNRQQAYFPDGSQVLVNPQGTAAGFTIAIDSRFHAELAQQLWVFPGPPQEVSAVWEQGVEVQIQKLFPSLEPLHLYTWQCLGKSEAELGEITERMLSGSGLKTGYRAHRPYVEVKVWCPRQQLQAKQTWIKQLDQALSSWVITRQGEDLGEKLVQQLRLSESIEIVDAATGGLLARRLGSLLNGSKQPSLAQSVTLVTEWVESSSPEDWVIQALSNSDDETLTLVVSGITKDGLAAVGLREGPRFCRETIRVPYFRPEWIERAQAFMTEMALKRWYEWLIISTH
jgi:molybdenum cofactor synthesis domain-containing protein